MARFYTLKPEQIVKKIKELQSVGQHEVAIQALHDVVVSRRFRSKPIELMEPIMLKHIELCVELRKGKMVKECLHQYRNISHNSSVSSIETIIDKLLSHAEEKVANARAKVDKMGIDVNDLEVSETPESIMLSTVSGDQSKDRMDRAVVTPWLKFLWQSYRNVLDATKYIARLEPAYHSATLKTFQFCVTYNRKTEFRRICDILRSHCLNAKYTQQRFDVNLNSPDTIQRNLESRFVQLDIAIEFELWHEAFKSVEDIHNLLMASKEPPKPVMMANYYEKLIKLCMVSGDHLFHSAAWNHYSFFERFSNKNLPEKHQSHIASMVLLSALAIPIITTTNTRPGYVQMDEHHISKWDNLSRLMGLSAHPTRTGLLKEALNKGILSCVLPEIRDMYNILEVQFHPLSICKKAGPIMIKLSKYPDLSKYLRPLQEVILTRLLQQLSQVYTTVKLDFFLNLASFPASFTFDALAIEKFIMNGCSRGELNIRIDHASNSFTFQTSLFVSPKNTVTEGIQSQSSPVDLMCTQLSRLGISLHGVVQMVDPCVKKSAIRAKEEAVCRALKGVEEEHRAAIIRTYEIERLKEDTEDKIERQEELAVHEKIIEAEKKVEAEKKRAEMEIKRREQEKQKRIRNEIKRDQVKRLAEGLHDKSAFQLNDEEIEKSKVKELENLKVIAMQKERKVFLKRLGQLNRRVDHAERAYRTEEILLLGKDYENQQKSDNAFYEASQKAYLNNTKLRFDKDIKLKKRLSRISDDQNIFKEKIEERRRQVTETLRIKADQAIKQEKQERIALWRQKRDEILKAYQAEQAEIARNEREEHEGTERERKEREEREARIAKEEEEYAERKRKFDETERIQAERDAEIERKLSAKTTAPAKNTHKPPGATYAASTNSKSKNRSSHEINRSVLPNVDTSWRNQHLGRIDNNDKYRGSDARQRRSELSGFNDRHRNDRYDNRSNNSEDNGGEWIIGGKKKDKRDSEHSSGGGVGQRSKTHNNNRDIDQHGYNRGFNHPRGFNNPTGAGSGNTKREW